MIFTLTHLSSSTGTFLNNYDVTDRKLKTLLRETRKMRAKYKSGDYSKLLKVYYSNGSIIQINGITILTVFKCLLFDPL